MERERQGPRRVGRAPQTGLRWETVQVGGFFLALAVAWELAVGLFRVKEYLLPAPSAIALELWQSRWILLQHSVITLNETVWGFLAGVAAGVLLAAGIFFSRFARRTVYPLVVALQSVPKAAVAPLLIVWFGYGLASKVVMSFLIAFFPIVIAALGGLMSTPEHLLEHFRSHRASWWATFWRLRVPSALPSFVDGCKVAMPLAVIGAVIGEFVGSNEGLGNLIMLASGSMRTTLVFAALTAVTLLSLALFAIVEALGSFVWWRSR
jgi:NitT/TauT family transport system permease protein